MYTIFLIKSKTTDPETGENVYVCGPAGHEIALRSSDITCYCTTPDGELIRYETYNEEIAARLMLDSGFVANKEEDVPADLLEQSRYYTWGDAENQTSGDYAAWVAAGRPETISTSGPAQIFGPGEAEHMTQDQARSILGMKDEVIQ